MRDGEPKETEGCRYTVSGIVRSIEALGGRNKKKKGEKRKDRMSEGKGWIPCVFCKPAVPLRMQQGSSLSQY